MNVADTMPTAAFPALWPLDHQKGSQAPPPIDATLVCLCASLRKELQGKHRFRAIEAQGWENFKRGTASVHALIHRIAETHAATHIRLPSKVLAPYALLNDDGSQRYNGTVAPDLLGWSLHRISLRSSAPPRQPP